MIDSLSANRLRKEFKEKMSCEALQQINELPENSGLRNFFDSLHELIRKSCENGNNSTFVYFNEVQEIYQLSDNHMNFIIDILTKLGYKKTYVEFTGVLTIKWKKTMIDKMQQLDALKNEYNSIIQKRVILIQKRDDIENQINELDLNRSELAEEIKTIFINEIILKQLDAIFSYCVKHNYFLYVDNIVDQEVIELALFYEINEKILSNNYSEFYLVIYGSYHYICNTDSFDKNISEKDILKVLLGELTFFKKVSNNELLTHIL